MIGKKFTDLSTGRVVEIKDSFEDIAVLVDGSKIRVSRLLDRNYFDEYIDPKTFFNTQSLFDNFAQKIRQIPDDVVRSIRESNESISTQRDFEMPQNSDPFAPATNESAVLPYDPEVEKEQIMRKYGIQKDPLIEARQQMEKINSLLNNMDGNGDDEMPLRIDVMRDEVEAIPMEALPIGSMQSESKLFEKSSTQQANIPPFDPVYQMFRGMKRNQDFKFQITIEEKIPRFDTIEMLEDSFDFSVVDFLATEFTNNLLENPEIIKKMIVEEIRRLMSEGSESPKPKKKTTTKKTTQND